MPAGDSYKLRRNHLTAELACGIPPMDNPKDVAAQFKEDKKVNFDPIDLGAQREHVS